MSVTQEEVIKAIHSELDSKLATFVRQSWYLLIGLAITMAAAWYSLYFQVQTIDQAQKDQVISNKEAIADNKREIDSLRTDYRADLKEIKEDLKFIRNSI